MAKILTFLKSASSFVFPFLVALAWPCLSKARVEVYGGVLIGATKMDETLLGSSYTHSNTFFVGHFGFGGGGRWLVEMDKFSLGVVSEITWNGDSLDRKQSGVTIESTYRYESYRLLAGASAALKFGALSLVGEYYPWAQNTVTFSDDKSDNPFRKNDKLKSTGFGLGFNYDLGSGFAYSAIYRRFTFKEVDMNGTAVTLPNSQYTTLNMDDVIVSIIKSF